MSHRSIDPEGLARPFGPFSQVTVSRPGTIVHVAGQVAFDAEGNVVGEGDIVAQTRQVMENLEIALGAAGADFSHVVKITNYVTDADEYPKIAPVREEYLKAPYPASTLIVAKRLIYPELLIEIEAVAVVPDA
jgi:enamine deaminase RidA (YjgF/YER057c/UK114 family)